MATQSINLERLRKAAGRGDPEIGRGEAFALLAASRAPKGQELLASVLQDLAEPAAIRSAAALAIGRIPTREAEQILIGNLKDADPAVQPEILRALGRIGREQALAAIDSLRLPERDHRVLAAQFAAALISHRLGREGHEWPLPPEESMLKAPRKNVQPIRFSPVAAEQSRKVIDDLTRQLYGVEYDNKRLAHVDCAGEMNVVCINLKFTEPGSTRRLLERKALLGVAAFRSLETGDYSSAYLLMTAPAKPPGGVNIVVPYCSGKLALAGRGEVAGDRMKFQLRAVERPGAAAVEISGDFAAGQLTIGRAVTSLERAPRRRLVRVEADTSL